MVNETVKNKLRNITQQDFLNFGADHIAYVRSVNVEGIDKAGLYSAEGKLIAVLASEDMAGVAARSHNLDVMPLH